MEKYEGENNIDFEELDADQETNVSRREQRRRRIEGEEHSKRSGKARSSRQYPNGTSAAVIVLLIIFVIGAIAGILGGKAAESFGKRTDEDSIAVVEVSPEQSRLDGIKKAFADGGMGVLEILRKYFPDDIVCYKDGKYIFVPFDPELKQNSFDSEKVRKNTDGTWGYVDGDMEVIKGIDVSSHQGEIDWGTVAGTNVEFAIIRALYRGYESGKLVEDKQFRYNIENAKRVGLKTGVYIFTQAISKAEADEEISMLNGLLGAYDGVDLPVVVDVESVSGSEARMDKLSREERTEIIKYYCEQLKKAGYEPMIYFNLEGAINLVDLKELEDFEKWFAVYDSDFYYPYAYTMWQYKDTGYVDGISGNVDLDLYFPGLK